MVSPPLFFVATPGVIVHVPPRQSISLAQEGVAEPRDAFIRNIVFVEYKIPDMKKVFDPRYRDTLTNSVNVNSAQLKRECSDGISSWQNAPAGVFAVHFAGK